VFSLNTQTGAEAIVYAFQDGLDGAGPLGGVIDVDGLLYGTTSSGGNGAGYDCYSGCGTVFALDPGTGAETVIHAFQGGTDGVSPLSSLISVGGKLYGTTLLGGAGNGGIIFEINHVTNTERVVHAFALRLTDGTGPRAALTAVGNTLYGTTSGGGENAAGTVFAYTP
jgi:uncharacterized repeat protein (TIGR03803 family)